ncbi:MAG: D-alanyl-D-alanine carboxypeptidase/D-alanyl-D-alanine-endopeptidase [Planctomycetes bacterium]|nr:D-alanyl-D-alanine carboxypeptidase/D-alanyl-D-alanine-endopeptidase [Planctomycetota bacterium]NUQ33312.1 D-alanyl-D-alanine carboxypeptidase/D-alanyl-D-alanine-endopeptidase [Planctomycetaceae bacterium]
MTRLLVRLTFVATILLVAVEPAAPAIAAGQTMEQALGAPLAPSKAGKETRSGAVVIDLDTGKTVYSHNADTALTPASNMKLFTTAAALCELGENFELRTEIRTHGTIRGGELDGDLVLVGFGDPNISGRFHNGDATFVLREMAKELRKKGISKVRGKLLFDDSYFSGASFHPDWPADQYLKWYTAEVSALCLNDNCLTITVTPGKSGEAARIACVPETRYATFEGSVQTISGRADPLVGWTRPRDSNTLSLWGKVANQRAAYQGECTVHDPAAFFAKVLAEVLGKEGIAINGGVERKDFSADELNGFELAARHVSDLPATLFVTNTDSQNLYAECLFRILGARKAGEGSFTGGAKAVQAFLKNASLPVDGLVIRDGSGLADTNRVTTRTLASLLQYMSKRKDFAVFKNSLAVAGSTGTLERRLTGDLTNGRVFAKTGYINKVGALSGYIDTKAGKRYAFAVVVNDVRGSVRTILDGFVNTLSKW